MALPMLRFADLILTQSNAPRLCPHPDPSRGAAEPAADRDCQRLQVRLLRA